MSLADETLFAPTSDSLFRPARSFSWNLISTRSTQFSYFDSVLGQPRWKGQRILDLGGNVGTFLIGAGSRVDHEDYWCIDLNRDVVEQGRRTYPRAHFVHYNRYSSQYNPNGIRGLPLPDCGVKFDIILAFSVFTHTDQKEILELVASLRAMLTDDGRLAFTFWDPHADLSQCDPGYMAHAQVRRHFYSPHVDEKVRRSRWWILIDDKLYVEPGDELSQQMRTGGPLESYTSFFTSEYMKSLFPEASIYPPVSPEWQHCCILRKA